MIGHLDPFSPDDVTCYSDEPTRCACGNPIDETSWDKCSDCLVPKCEVIGCNKPRAVGDEADACTAHNLDAALEDLRDLEADGKFSMVAQDRVYRWRMACEKAGVKEAVNA